MTDQTSKATPKGSREERLKQALRENLKRRKAQSRERSQATTPAEQDDGEDAARGGPDDVTR
jgi:hypothetical protein